MDLSFFQNNPAFGAIDNNKLAFLTEFATNQAKASQTDLLPLLFAASSSARKKGITFSDEEKQLIISSIKPKLSPSEQAKLDKMLAILKKQGL